MDYKKEEIFNNGIAVIYYWPEVKLLENQWLKKVALDVDAYRTPFIEALNFANKNKIVYYLSDIRNEGIVPVSEKNWFKNEILPKAIEKGLQFAAVVTSGNVFKTYYMNALIKVGNIFELPIKTFNDYQKAIEWLLKNEENKN